jgi:hypothetical protein
VREPELATRRVQAKDTRPLTRVTLMPNPPGTLQHATELRTYGKDDERGRTLRRDINDDTLRLARAAASPDASQFDYELWTDATVHKGETPDCTSAGYAALWSNCTPAATQQPLHEWSGSAGRLACSYTAERHTLRSGLKDFTPRLLSFRPARLLVGVDNQGLVASLAAGPLATDTNPNDEIWYDLHRLASAGWTIVVVFVFSHVGTPRNEFADKGAETARAGLTQADHDTAPVDYHDVTRAIKTFWKQQWEHDTAALTRRTLFAGTPHHAPFDLNQLEHDPALFVETCRARVDCSPHYGKLLRILQPSTIPACRLCKRTMLNQAPPPPAPPVRVPPLRQQPPPQPLPPQPPPQPVNVVPPEPDANGKVTCPVCDIKVSKSYLKKHLASLHAVLNAPEAQPHKCECGRIFTTASSLRTHRRACAVWQALPTTIETRRQQTQARADADTIETFPHFWRGQCRAFSYDKKSMHVYVESLLNSLGAKFRPDQ